MHASEGQNTFEQLQWMPRTGSCEREGGRAGGREGGRKGGGRECVPNLRSACSTCPRTPSSPSRTYTFSARILVSVHTLLSERRWGCGGTGRVSVLGGGRRAREKSGERGVVWGQETGRCGQFPALLLEIETYLHTWGGGV